MNNDPLDEWSDDLLENQWQMACRETQSRAEAHQRAVEWQQDLRRRRANRRLQARASHSADDRSE